MLTTRMLVIIVLYGDAVLAGLPLFGILNGIIWGYTGYTLITS